MDICDKISLFLLLIEEICSDKISTAHMLDLYPLARVLAREIKEYRETQAAQSGGLAAGGLVGAAGEPSGSAASGGAPFDSLGL